MSGRGAEGCGGVCGGVCEGAEGCGRVRDGCGGVCEGADGCRGCWRMRKGAAGIVLGSSHGWRAKARRPHCVAALYGVGRRRAGDNCFGCSRAGLEFLRSDLATVGGPPAHIAEGFARFKPREFVRYLRMALGSLAETRTHLERGRRRAYFTEEQHQAASSLLNRSTYMVTRLLQSKLRQLEAEEKATRQRKRTEQT